MDFPRFRAFQEELILRLPTFLASNLEGWIHQLSSQQINYLAIWEVNHDSMVLIKCLHAHETMLEDWFGTIEISFEDKFKWFGHPRSNLNIQLMLLTSSYHCLREDIKSNTKNVQETS